MIKGLRKFKGLLLTRCCMKYQCKFCGKKFEMWLQIGLCEGGKNHKPVPFMIRCNECGGHAYHVMWNEDVYLESPIKIDESMSYFANLPDHKCGIPILRKKVSSDV